MRVSVEAPQVALWLSWSPVGDTRIALAQRILEQRLVAGVLPTSDSVVEVENAGPVIRAIR